MTSATQLKQHIDATLRDPRWTQMRNRDRAADGSFWYSVRSTGVYCKPSCAARPARPENVAFHDSREAAERAGFRPCARCKPDRSRETLHYGISGSPLGLLLAAESEHGICAILFGQDAHTLEADLRRRFPQAELSRDDAALRSALQQTIALIEHPERAFAGSLDLRGTPFQRKVWQALRSIPAGATASYKEVAARIGMPDAARAVAQACGANALALAVPCHRVVRGDGALSGYRWGVDRKRALLAREARA